MPELLSVNLARFDNSWYRPGKNILVRTAWFFLGLPALRCAVLPGSSWRRVLLRLFGATIGAGVVIKPGVRVKYPWRLTVGKYSWIGEDCWIDNLADTVIEDNVCVSQGVYICTGNHVRSDPHFGLIVKPIALRSGCWIGARTILCPGVEISQGAVATAGSVVTTSLPAWEIHAGNPAAFVKRRVLKPRRQT